ncbi:hypothetical protein LTR53_017212 [Teratosphaeriaceae sp. CCFEE 6253]|nr:hypothetical protein LTR53_017212 [Teratosphaeriaceae sp. CCFEE 6253]
MSGGLIAGRPYGDGALEEVEQEGGEKGEEGSREGVDKEMEGCGDDGQPRDPPRRRRRRRLPHGRLRGAFDPRRPTTPWLRRVGHAPGCGCACADEGGGTFLDRLPSGSTEGRQTTPPHRPGSPGPPVADGAVEACETFLFDGATTTAERCLRGSVPRRGGGEGEGEGEGGGEGEGEGEGCSRRWANPDPITPWPRPGDRTADDLSIDLAPGGEGDGSGMGGEADSLGMDADPWPEGPGIPVPVPERRGRRDAFGAAGVRDLGNGDGDEGGDQGERAADAGRQTADDVSQPSKPRAESPTLPYPDGARRNPLERLRRAVAERAKNDAISDLDLPLSAYSSEAEDRVNPISTPSGPGSQPLRRVPSTVARTARELRELCQTSSSESERPVSRPSRADVRRRTSRGWNHFALGKPRPADRAGSVPEEPDTPPPVPRVGRPLSSGPSVGTVDGAGVDARAPTLSTHRACSRQRPGTAPAACSSVDGAREEQDRVTGRDPASAAEAIEPFRPFDPRLAVPESPPVLPELGPQRLLDRAPITTPSHPVPAPGAPGPPSHSPLNQGHAASGHPPAAASEGEGQGEHRPSIPVPDSAVEERPRDGVGVTVKPGQNHLARPSGVGEAEEVEGDTPGVAD